MKGPFVVTIAFLAGLALLTLLPQGVTMASYDNAASSPTQLSRLDELSGSEAQLYGLPTPPEMASNNGHGNTERTAHSGYGNEQGAAFAANAAERHWYTIEKETHWYPNGLGDM